MSRKQAGPKRWSLQQGSHPQMAKACVRMWKGMCEQLQRNIGGRGECVGEEEADPDKQELFKAG